MLIIKAPKTYENERHYIFGVIFEHFLGLEYSVQFEENRSDIEITKVSDSVKKLCIKDVLFSFTGEYWLKKSSLPTTPLVSCDLSHLEESIPLVKPAVPVIYGASSNDKYLECTPDQVLLGIDVFGSAFYMLTCYEEYVNQIGDTHGRYPTQESLSVREGFFSRPIVNEYLEILWFCLSQLWPDLKRKERLFSMTPSHDVDVPFANAFLGPKKLLRSVAGDFILRKSPHMAGKRLASYFAVKQGNYKKDVNYTFDSIMDTSEKNNTKSIFFFKAGCTNKKYDNDYLIEHTYLKKLLTEIHARGHEIGLHTSYMAYDQMATIKEEFDKLVRVCESCGIKQDKWGVRQHYLRFKNPVTWRCYDQAGLVYDSTVSFSCGGLGFKSGTCYDYPVFDLENEQELKLYEHPLVIMESALIKSYMTKDSLAQALSTMITYKDVCRKYHGDFTLLWHNNRFLNKHYWNCYNKIMAY